MAIWGFTAKILAGKPIQGFGHGDMRRDFTFIDDIVAGVIAALDNPPVSYTHLDVYKRQVRALRIVMTMLPRGRVPVAARGLEIGAVALARGVDVDAVQACGYALRVDGELQSRRGRDDPPFASGDSTGHIERCARTRSCLLYTSRCV